MNVKIERIPWLSLAALGVLVLLYARTLNLLGHVWWYDPDYSHGLLVPIVAGIMLWTGREALRRGDAPRSVLPGAALIVPAILLLFVGIRGPVHLAQYIALCLMLAGLALYTGGFDRLRRFFAPLALLLLAVPLPTVVMNQIAAPLQLFASQCAVWGMQAFEIPLVREGNVIEMMPYGALTPHKLEVVQACSGIRSLMSLVTMGFMLSYFTYPKLRLPKGGDGDGGARQWWKEYGFWRSVALVAAAVPIAVLTNAIRVSGTGVLSYYYGIEVAEGFFHSFSGAMTYTLAAILLLALGWTMDRLFLPKRRGVRRSAAVGGEAAAV